MIRSFSAAALALLLVASLPDRLAAQSMGLQLRVDRSTSAADPDDVPDVEVLPAANGFEVRTGPAAVVWNPANTTTGDYTLRATFRLVEPSNHVNYYGFVLGGRDLGGPMQNYLYFLVAQDGSFIIKHRAGEETHDIVPRTSNTAVNAMDANGQSTNTLEVRVADNVEFVANGTVLHSVPKTRLAASTNGIYGVRVNHTLRRVAVDGLTVTR